MFKIPPGGGGGSIASSRPNRFQRRILQSFCYRDKPRPLVDMFFLFVSFDSLIIETGHVHHTTYAPAKFEVDMSKDLRGGAFTRIVTLTDTQTDD